MNDLEQLAQNIQKVLQASTPPESLQDIVQRLQKQIASQGLVAPTSNTGQDRWYDDAHHYEE